MASTSTGNNKMENYDLSNDNPDLSFSPSGTGEFDFLDCIVTAVVYASGMIATTHEEDPLIGQPIVNNPAMVPPKIVDLDSPQHDFSSTFYGMRFGVNWKPNAAKKENNNSFIGEWLPSIVSRDNWKRQISNREYMQTQGTQGGSKLVNVQWGRVTSKGLGQLKEMYDITNFLSVSVSLFNYSRIKSEDRFIHGNVVGTIGVGMANESLNFVSERVMNFVKDPPTSEGTLKDSNCDEAENWMHTAYFNINPMYYQRFTVTVDFGNAIKLDPYGIVCDFGPLYLGLIVQTMTQNKMFEVIGEIPYRDPQWYSKTSGVNDFPLTPTQHRMSENSPFAVVKINGEVEGKYPLCAKNGKTCTCAHVILKESPLQARPVDHHVMRLEAEESIQLKMLVREFGKPMANKQVMLLDRSPNASPRIRGGLEFDNPIETDEYGIATFSFTAKEIGRPRGSLDGQVYVFAYCVGPKSKCVVCKMDCQECKDECQSNLECGCEDTYTNQISFLVWGKTTYTEPVFWDDHIKPIFQQYERLYPTMKNILRLGEYDDIVKPYNVLLLKKAMSLDFNHPSYMPVSRDLSPSRIKMILKWLNSDGLYRNWSHVEETHYKSPDFCRHKIYSEGPEPYLMAAVLDADKAATNIESLRGDSKNAKRFRSISLPLSKEDIPDWMKEERCSIESLKRDLQDAVRLEFATIPPYLTSMYSIKAGHNAEVYAVIRSVVMQEMLHMAQAANILISLGGHPLIDDIDAVPHYPGRLPAGVLPQLIVTLQKASPKHIYDVFMMIEFPQNVTYTEQDVGKDQITIGKFYENIKNCMVNLTENGTKNIFDKGKIPQLYWPWKHYDTTSTLYEVTDLESALKAIKMIVEQGEGAEPQDPTYLDTDRLAHFYKFEELVCKRHLDVKHRHDYYDTPGEDIEFKAEGVWPMRDNPSVKGIPYGTQVYYKARNFHRVYRSLLAKLQEMFDGSPKAVDDAVYLMESLQIHTKELMKVEVPSPPGWPKHTCGPIFDYEWDDSKTI